MIIGLFEENAHVIGWTIMTKQFLIVKVFPSLYTMRQPQNIDLIQENQTQEQFWGWEFTLLVNNLKNIGLDRDLNPGPLAP